MAENNNGQSDALKGAAAKRVKLKQALSQVEVAAAAPFAGEGWQEELLRTLEDLRLALLDHIREVEAHDGLLAEMTAQAPRLANQIAHVRDEHPGLCIQVAQVIMSVQNNSNVDDLRAEVLETLTAVARHRQKGSDLVYEAYSVDIGGT
jgi:hypothetical protein